MSRIIRDSKVWYESEDEIIKAGVKKYGNYDQWSEIAWFLPKKSEKQCRSRWNEWLDPNIKKTEWTMNEESQLIDLLKDKPSQWRSIALIMKDRTAIQCYEHFQYMLDREAGGNLDECVSDFIDYPDAQPAKPDPDDEELKMLSKVRSYLVNPRCSKKDAERRSFEKRLNEALLLVERYKRPEAGICRSSPPRKRRKTD